MATTLYSPHSRTLDFALMAEQLNSSPAEDQTHIVFLDPISISYERFEELFYFREDGKFRISVDQCDANEYILAERTVADESFNLISTVISFYEEDLGLASTKWEVCSLIDLQKQLMKLGSLCKYCNTTCSLTRGEIVQAILAEGGVVDGIVVHRLRLNILFTNANPDIRDVRVVLQYDVPIETASLEINNARFC